MTLNIEDWLHLVKHKIIQFRRRNYRLDRDELFSYGSEGLLYAIKTYKPELSKSFVGHAFRNIEYYMWNGMNRQPIKIPTTNDLKKVTDNQDFFEDVDLLDLLNNCPNLDNKQKYMIQLLLKGASRQDLGKALGVQVEVIDHWKKKLYAVLKKEGCYD